MLRRVLRRIVRNLLFAILTKRPKPATDRERELIRELRTTIGELPRGEPATPSGSEQAWTDHAEHLRELVLTRDPREFLRWELFHYTMFVLYARSIDIELRHLKSRPDWSSRWRQAIKETGFGRPLPYWRYPRSSGNLIHHAYHLAQFEEETAKPVNDMSFVFEFGGGYGGMCRLFHNLNFRGKYVIFDLPHFSALQKFFLGSIGITVHSPDSFKSARSGVICVSGIEELRTILASNAGNDSSMFIATWSISEAPISLRNSILSLASQFDTFLVASQSRFEGINNVEYFEDWKDTQTDLEWHRWQIEHMGRNFYLVGKRKAGMRPQSIQPMSGDTGSS